MIVYDTLFLRVSVEEVTNLMVAEWRGHATEAEFKAGVDALCNLVQQRKITKALSDTTQVGPISQAMQTYLDDSFPRLYAVGLRAIATVLPARVVSQINVAVAVQAQSNAGIMVTIVPTVQDARAWLAKQP